MESNFNKRDFEEFVKQNADQYRMFPSEKVWKGIDNALHTRRRWYGLGLALLLLLTGAGVALVMLTSPDKSAKHSLSSSITFGNKSISQEKVTQTNKPEDNQIKAGPIEFGESPLLKQTMLKANSPLLVNVEQVSENNTIAPEEEFVLITAENTINHNSISPILNTSPLIQKNMISSENEVISKESVSQSLLASDNSNEPRIEKPTESQDKELSKEVYPLTIESVLNTFKKPASKKLSWQVYIAPTVSYRKLSENKGFLQAAALNGFVPSFAAYSDVKNFVIHKPDLGLELGASARYSLNKSFTVKAGVQFNVSRYDIKAYTYPGEIATIALDAGSGNNSISTSTVYRARYGNRSNWLQNLYYSASTPVGIEYKFNSVKSTYFGVAATFQPTYVITNRAYLLSTDYKNYVEVPSLTRRWNMNTGFEAFVSYKSGKTRWQIGPQVRYQLKSSFIDTYPVKENLFDFGLKVGVTLNNK